MKVKKYEKFQWVAVELPDGKGELRMMEIDGEIEIMLSTGYSFDLVIKPEVLNVVRVEAIPRP